MEFTLSQEEFSSLIKVLSVLQEECSDCDIRKGLVRQQTNSRTSVFYINLSTLLHEQNIPIVVLKQKLELFKCFEGSEVRFSIGNDSYVISDSYSSLKMDFAVLEYMDNKFITQDEFEKKTSLPDENLLLSISVSKLICERIKNISKVFNTNIVVLDFVGETANLVSRSSSKENYAKFLTEIPLNKNMTNIAGNLPLTPFLIDADGDIQLDVYAVRADRIITRNIMAIDAIDIEVFSRAQLGKGK